MHYSKKKKLTLLNTLLWIALRLLRNPILKWIRFFYIAFKRLNRNLKWVLYCYQKLYLKRVMYIHFLILLIGFECFYPPKNLTKHRALVEFIGCTIDIGCFLKNW